MNYLGGYFCRGKKSHSYSELETGWLESVGLSEMNTVLCDTTLLPTDLFSVSPA